MIREKFTLIALAVIVIALSGGIGLVLFKKPAPSVIESTSPEPTPLMATQIEPPFEKPSVEEFAARAQKAAKHVFVKPPLPKEIASWRTHRDEDMGFELKYPDYYKEFVPRTGYDSVTDANLIAAFAAKPIREDSHPSFAVSIFPLNSYQFKDPPDATEYWYDAEKDEWLEHRPGYGTMKAYLSTLRSDEWVGYRLGWGDGGHLESIIAIPYKERGLMIEFSFYYWPLTEEDGQDELIFSTLKRL